MRFANLLKLSASLLLSGSVACCGGVEPPGPVDPPDPDPDPEEPVLVINEVCGTAGSQWIEILNDSEIDAETGGYRLVYVNPASGSEITLAAIPADTQLKAGAYYVFDKSAETMSGSFDMAKTLKLHLVSADNKKVSSFDRDTQIGENETHPGTGSYARFPGDPDDRWAVTTTPTKGAANVETGPPAPRNIQNAIWMWSQHFPTADFTELAGYGINHIIIHEKAITEMGTAAFKSRVDAARAAGINIHVWFVCFHNTATGTWINPVNTTTHEYNQPYFDELIARAKTYAGFGNIAGIHLDYVRYPGSSGNRASDFVYVDTDVTGQGAIASFCRQMSEGIKAIDPKIKLSAAVMPETSANASVYGQNTQRMAASVDIFMPMIYRYSYTNTNAWLFNTTKWFVTEAKKGRAESEVWAGVTTYDGSVNKLPAATMARDCGYTIRKDGVDSGSTGVVLFRYSLVNYFDMTKDYYLYY